MSVYQLKSRFQNLLRPLVVRLAAGGVTANQVTVAAALVSIILGAFLAWSGNAAWFALVPVWLFLRMALNAVDGMLACEHGQKSTLGAYLNEIADVVSDAALYAPFALPGLPWVPAAAMTARWARATAPWSSACLVPGSPSTAPCRTGCSGCNRSFACFWPRPPSSASQTE